MSGLAEAVAERERLSKRLKHATRELHETLDRRMMAADLFSSRERYALFLAMQRRFHRDIEALYRDPALAAIAPDLAQRRKLDEIDRDLADIGRAPPPENPRPIDPAAAGPSGLGWLYVAEGSSLGAAFLLKAAAPLGLDETFGARHLAAHPEGRGLHWRRFTQALDDAALPEADESRAEAAAVEAFLRVSAIAEETLAEPTS